MTATASTKALQCGSSRILFEIASISAVTTSDSRQEQEPQQEGKLTKYLEETEYLLETYTTGDLIADAQSKIVSFKDPGRMTIV